jgi:hypothetical protein
MASACTYKYSPGVEHCEEFRYGHQTHVIFAYDGPPEHAAELRHVADRGISDDIRVQRLVDELLLELENRGFGLADRWGTHDHVWLQSLSEPRSLWGTLSQATRVPDAEGEEPFLYQWVDAEGGVIAISERNFRERSAKNRAAAQFGRRGGPSAGNCVQLSVSSPREGPQAVNAIDKRNASSTIYGVMGIIVDRDKIQLPPGLVHNTVVSISARSMEGADVLDEIVIAALNRCISPREVVQFYRHATLKTPGDSDGRVAMYMESVRNAVLIKHPDNE